LEAVTAQQITVTTSARKVWDFDIPGSVMVLNRGPGKVFLGGEYVGSDFGFEIHPLATVNVDASLEWWSVAESGSAVLSFLIGGNSYSPSPSEISAQIEASGLAADINAAIEGGQLPVLNAEAFNKGTEIWRSAGGIAASKNSTFLDVEPYQAYVVRVSNNADSKITVTQYDSVAGLNVLDTEVFQVPGTGYTVWLKGTCKGNAIAFSSDMAAAGSHLVIAYGLLHPVEGVKGREIKELPGAFGFFNGILATNGSGVIANGANSAEFPLVYFTGKIKLHYWILTGAVGSYVRINFKNEAGASVVSIDLPQMTSIVEKYSFELWPTNYRITWQFLNRSGGNSSMQLSAIAEPPT
jgi:hypothetical protein